MSDHATEIEIKSTDSSEHTSLNGTGTQTTSSTGFSFEFNADGTLKAVYESENGVLKPESVDPNAKYTLQADGSVVKTEVGSYGTETTVYAKVNGGSLLTQVSHTWAPNTGSSTTTAATATPTTPTTVGHDDWYEYSGSASQYHVEHTSDGKVTVTNAQTMQKVDTSVAAQRVLFADQALAFDEQGNAGQAYRLYKAAFDREADHGGLGYWIAQLDNGTVNLQGAAHAFMQSTEFQSLYGANVTSDKFLDLLYTNVLNRTADASGKTYWTDMLAHGISREEVFVNFSESAENKAEVAKLIGTGGIAYTPYH